VRRSGVFVFAVPFKIWLLLMLVIASLLLTIGLMQAIKTEVRQARKRKRRARR